MENIDAKKFLEEKFFNDCRRIEIGLTLFSYILSIFIFLNFSEQFFLGFFSVSVLYTYDILYSNYFSIIMLKLFPIRESEIKKLQGVN